MVSTFGNEIDRSSSGESPADRLRIRAVVPFLDEEACIEAALTRLRAVGVDTIVAVDGGSRDRSAQRAARHADCLRTETGGLARQLNLGARGAAEDVLLFCYADCSVPRTLRPVVERLDDDPRCVGGAFRLSLDDERPVYRLIAWGANLRARSGLGPFGDQGIFVRRDAFESIGGFREDRLLEDLDLVRRLRRIGIFRLHPDPIVSSVRRWERDGIVRTTVRHWAVLARHLAGRRGPRARAEYARWRTGGR